MSDFALPVRGGDPPLVSDTEPYEQLTQAAPEDLQRRLSELAEALPGVKSGPSLCCVIGSRSWQLIPAMARGPLGAYLAGTEFAHIHPPYDGSLHAMLPPRSAAGAVANGWGRYEPGRSSVLLYGPRDKHETEVIWQLILQAYRYASTDPEPR